MRAALEAEVFEAVKVSASDVDHPSGERFAWDVTFTSVAGDLSSSVECVDSNLTVTTDGQTSGSGGDPNIGCVVETKRAATSSALAGDFTLTFRGETTGSIAADADADTVRSALLALSTIGDVNVTEITERHTAGSAKEWLVAFLAPRENVGLSVQHAGDMPALVADATC